MKKTALALSIIFIILTFIGAGYVLYNRGQVNAGYAIIPLGFALACIAFYRNRK
ncbi:MAG: hypothetical protein HFI03_16645 [Lachnospiraceae bacterium]|nr:hypothetical protein [Lachnospiraceae bacterium]